MTNHRPIGLLSIVSPVYRAENIIDELIKRISEEVKKIDLVKNFEILLIEDGSPDDSWKKIEENCKKFNYVKGIKLSRNFGQHFAITAGLDKALGDYVIVMDCDLQDNPKYIKDLLDKAIQGFDVVYTVKKHREHSFFKNLTASLFNKFFNFLLENSNLQGSNEIGAYSILSRKVVNEYKKFGDYNRHYLSVVRWLGFDFTFLHIEHSRRFEGESSYNLRKLLSHALNGIISQSNKLLYLNTYFGFFISFISFCFGLYQIISYFTTGRQNGWTSLIVAIFFSLGILLISLGIVGIYIGKVFEQVKGRQKYIVDSQLNFNIKNDK